MTLVAVIGSALLGAGLVAAACGVERPRVDTTTTVEMRGFGFVPAQVEVAVGDTVVFVNRDALPHTATADSRAWDSGEMLTGERWTWVATEGGAIEYLCVYHPSMRGTITVR